MMQAGPFSSQPLAGIRDHIGGGGMQYEKVERDFVKRSLELLKQYDDVVRYATPIEQHCEVTLLLNCLLGLIILPFEHSKRAQGNKRFPQVCEGDDAPISQLDSTWGLDRLNIERFILDGNQVKSEDATLRKIVATFRHSLSHSQFGDGSRQRRPPGLSVGYGTASYDPIESVIFQVNLANEYKNQVEFVATIPVDALRQFASRFANAFLNSSTILKDAS